MITMNKEMVEKIISNLSEQGYNIERKEIKENSIHLDYGDCMFYFNFENTGLIIKSVLKLDYRSTFDQENVNYLNSITSYWSIYKHWIEFNYKPKNEEELENTLKELLESYN